MLLEGWWWRDRTASSLRRGFFLLAKQETGVSKESVRSVAPAGQLECSHTGILRTCLLFWVSHHLLHHDTLLDSCSSLIEQGFLLTETLLIIHLFGHPFIYPSLLIQLSLVFSCAYWQLFKLTALDYLRFLICSFFSFSFIMCLFWHNNLSTQIFNQCHLICSFFFLSFLSSCVYFGIIIFPLK